MVTSVKRKFYVLGIHIGEIRIFDFFEQSPDTCRLKNVATLPVIVLGDYSINCFIDKLLLSNMTQSPKVAQLPNLISTMYIHIMLRKQLDNIIQPFDTTQQQSFLCPFPENQPSMQHFYLRTIIFLRLHLINQIIWLLFNHHSFTWSKRNS